MGSVRLTERHLRSDPPTAAEIAAASADIDELLDRAEQEMALEEATSLVGVAGTVTTITAVAVGVQEHLPDATHGATLSIDEAVAVCDWLLGMTRQRRSAHRDRKSTRLNSSHVAISYAVFCLKQKQQAQDHH